MKKKNYAAVKLLALASFFQGFVPIEKKSPTKSERIEDKVKKLRMQTGKHFVRRFVKG